jgi:hypothetical protein
MVDLSKLSDTVHKHSIRNLGVKEVTRYLYRWYDPLRNKWFKSRIRLTEEQLREGHKDGYEILWDTAEKSQILESKEEYRMFDMASIPFDKKF